MREEPHHRPLWGVQGDRLRAPDQGRARSPRPLGPTLSCLGGPSQDTDIMSPS